MFVVAWQWYTMYLRGGHSCHNELDELQVCSNTECIFGMRDGVSKSIYVKDKASCTQEWSELKACMRRDSTCQNELLGSFHYPRYENGEDDEMTKCCGPPGGQFCCLSGA